MSDNLKAARAERQAAMRQALRERILVLDGAMGTAIQAYKLSEEDYRGERFADDTDSDRLAATPVGVPFRSLISEA